jgi:hypothetical protein
MVKYIRRKEEFSVLAFSLSFYTFIILYVNTDIQIHLNQIDRINYGSIDYPPNFLFYFLVNMLSGFTSNPAIMMISAVFLLSLATTAKYTITKKILNKWLWKDKTFLLPTNAKMTIYSFLLFFCFAIPDFYNFFVLKTMYTGRFVSMVWHNSTCILVFPFALLLFDRQLNYFTCYPLSSKKELFFIYFLILINILIKPSFIFVYLPGTFLIILTQKAKLHLDQYLKLSSPLIVASLFILIQFFLIYKTQLGSIQAESSEIAISLPFELLSKSIPVWYIPISILMSFLFPIIMVCTFPRILSYLPFKYAAYMTVCGIIIFSFVKEIGPRENHGNFYWQTVICTYLLFLTSVSFYIQTVHNTKNRISRLKKFIPLIALIMHGFSGILYILKLIVTESYV